MIEAKLVECIAKEVATSPELVARAIELLDGGATIPFIAQYRKDAIGDLTEAQLETILERNSYFIGLVERRNGILKILEKDGLATDELRTRIDSCYDKADLDELFLPFKKQRPSKATLARQKGLTPLADMLWSQETPTDDVHRLAEPFVRPEKVVGSTEEALEGARFILAERLMLDPGIRALIRDRMHAEGKITARPTKNAEGQKTKFEAYYTFSEPISSIPSHRLLAVLRGVKMGFLRMELEMDDDKLFADLMARCVRAPGSPYEQQVRMVMQDAYYRHLRPALEHETVTALHKRADREAIAVFRDNIANLLMAAPAGAVVVLGVTPGQGKATRLAVVDDSGAVVAHAVLDVPEAGGPADEPEAVVVNLVNDHHVHIVAVGSGATARDVGQFMREALAKNGIRDVRCVFVSDAGATTYASSKPARQELTDLDAATRSAVSTARRLQDPLRELVKLEPRNIGVGQYQHDVNQRQLREALHRMVVSCVSRVGVDLNSAPVELLRYVSGLQMGTAQNIVAYRQQIGGFKNRGQLIEVDGIGAKVFEQCSGFLRISGGDQPLDATAIHPEAYGVVGSIAAAAGVSVTELLRNREAIERIDLETFAGDNIGPRALRDIRDQLLHPGHDIRGRFRAPKFLDSVRSVQDLEEGMEMEGVITNVTDFGAFVDVGVQQDGLVHLSELANRYVVDPRRMVRVGQIVRVKVIKVDKESPRISLSMKAAAPPPRRRAPRKPVPAPKDDAAAPREDQAPREPRERRDRPPRDRAQDRDDARPRPRPAQDRRARPGEGDRSSDRRRPPRPDDRRPQRPSGPREFGRQDSGTLNTQLADQLAALRDKLGRG
ncbi:MAG TPA: Tex-like N-terminal domain-containing protein [Candidatus Hydrogenedentes bacterium]|nr:Tex-like N-terminal domain-containing protein [Candidatus Hydrogenedentota bacterium]HPG70203.1 Tex-like N-terminal domain-containing protein [Candidatus Hydrogenedentota bacterium]